MSNVTYFGGVTEVKLGDEIRKRRFFRWQTGRIVYVPGVSPMNPDMEFNGLKYVGLRFNNGALVATLVHPNTSSIKKAVEFVKRGLSINDEIKPTDRFNA